MDSFFIWVLRFLDARAGRLLDVSCGEGQLLRWARARGLEAHGVDISDVAVAIARNASGAAALAGNAQTLPYADASFDYLTNLGSLEHYDDMEAAVAEMARVVRPGGAACFMVPNSYGRRWNVRVVWRTGDIHDDGQPLQRYATRGEWQRLLEAGGFDVRRTLGYEWERATPYTWADAWGYLRRPKRILSLLHVRLTVPVNAASSLVYICTRREDDAHSRQQDA